MIDISIIIPVYNVEQYMKRCLDSVFNQQFAGTFEVIAVDDCSTDNSLQILYDYQKKEERLKIICHDENKKLSVARATGMLNAIGDYIMHIDSDDWILSDTLQKLYSKIQETNSDIVVFNYYREDNQGNKRYINRINKEKIFTDKDKEKIQFLFCGNSYTKIVRRELTEKMISGKVGVNATEDLLYCTEIFLRAKRICTIPCFYYVYFQNTGSITSTYNASSYLHNQIIILEQLENIFHNNKYKEYYRQNVLKYWEKWIYLGLYKIHLTQGKANKSQIEKFSPNKILLGQKFKRMLLAEKYFGVCLFEVVCRFDIRLVIRYWLNALKKN
jgi:glycosyltransferase involved in cell wall biosynthesis